MYISVLITTFNAEKFILEALDSIKNQTYQCYEVVIVDDGSSDNTVNVVRKYIKENNLTNFNVYPIEHIGRAKALVYAVNKAQYNWVAILDADDLWNKYKLEIQVEYMLQYKLQFLATAWDFFFSDDNVSLVREGVF